MKNKIKAIIFDHDDTLVGTIGPKWAQHKYIARTFYDKELKDADIRPHWGKPFTVLTKLFYTTDNIDMAMAYNIATRNKFPKVLFEDTIATLKAVQKLNVKMGIVTATTKSSLTYDFETLNIPFQLFEYIQTEDDTVIHKPNPDVFLPAVKWLVSQRILPNEVVYVGDSLNDMKASLGAGFQFVGVGTGLVSCDEFEKHGVKALKKLSDFLLLDMLQKN